MSLIPPEIRAQLRTNADASRSAEAREAKFDPVPLVKLFSPLSAATWLVTELDKDGDTLFGLADLGFGCPELGSFSLHEVSSIHLPFGLRIERDLAFSSHYPLSVWSAWARRSGSIIWAETLLNRASASAAPLDLSKDG